MSRWIGQGFSNLKGQLSEFTKEVLSETTEEVEDQEAELQVAKKKVRELEIQLTIAQKDIDLLRQQNSDLSEKAQSSELQLQSLSENYWRSLESKEAEIRNLQNQLHRESADSSSAFLSESVHSPPSPGVGEFEIIQLNNQIKQLKAEVQHWKNVVKKQENGSEQSSESLQQEISSLKRELSDTIEKHQAELVSLQELHSQQLASLRCQVKENLKPAVESDEEESWNWSGETNWPQEVGSSGESELFGKLETLKNQRDKTQKEKETLIQEKENLENEVCKERELNKELQQTVDTLKSWDEEETRKLQNDYEEALRKIKDLETEIRTLQDDLETMDAQQQAALTQLMESKTETLEKTKEVEEKLCSEEKEVEFLKSTLEQVRAENTELTAAYNDLNEEFEKQKSESGNMEVSNHDLNVRLESLKADLIEYEEKYEKCKAENVKALKQLETLSSEFDRLKEVLNSAKSVSSGESQQLQSEVNRLQEQLKHSSDRRDHLAENLEEFQNIMTKFEEEVNSFRTCNSHLNEENRELKIMVQKMLGFKEALDSDVQLEHLRNIVEQREVKYAATEQEVTRKTEELWEENEDLRSRLVKEKERVDLLQRKNDLAELASLKARAEEQEMQIKEIVGEKNCLQRQLEMAVEAYGVEGSAAAAGTEEEKMFQLETWINRYRVLVGDEAAAAVENTESDVTLIRSFLDSGTVGKEREETESGDSNGWDKLHEDASEPASEKKNEWAAGILTAAQLEVQLKEALAALTEKTEECEKIQKDVAEKGQELQEREDLLQQVFTELKGLEMQISDYREREETLKSNVHKLTVETAKKDSEIQQLKWDLEKTAENEQELDYKITHLESEKEHLMKALKEQETLMQSAAQLDASTAALQLEKVEIEHRLAEKQKAAEALETQLNNALSDLENVKVILSEQDKEKAELEQALADEKTNRSALLSKEKEMLQKEECLAASRTGLQNEKDQLIVLVNQKHEECLKYHQEAEQATQRLAQLQTQLTVTQRQLESASYHAKQLQSQVESLGENSTALRTETDSVKAYAAQLEGEKREILEQLEQMKTAVEANELRRNELSTQLNTMEQRNHELISDLEIEKRWHHGADSQLRVLDESKQKADREIQRLMDHLLQVEENYTREAVTAEERETNLRQQLREADQRALSHSEVAKGANEQMKDQIEDLKIQLEALAQQRDTALLELAESQEQVEKAQKSMTNLQGVLQHFQAERDSLVMEEVERYRLTAEDAQRERETVAGELASTQRKLKEKDKEIQQYQNLQESLNRKDSEIEFVRSQLHSKDSELADMRVRASQSEKMHNGKVDRELLKNLFLGYFTAPGDRKAEVAHLLGSILNFSVEDFKKVDGGNGNRWLNFMGRQKAGTAPSEHSITAEFIKFLEAESSPAASSTVRPVPMHLPEDEIGYGGRSSTSSGRSTPAAAGLLRQQFSGVPPVLTSTSVELPSFSGESPFRPPSTSSEFLKDVLQNE